MTEEWFTDRERHLLLGLLHDAVPTGRGDLALTNIIAKLSGVDTVLVARRAYPSRDASKLNTVGLRERIAISDDFSPAERDFILDAVNATPR